jgi:hypothetical protein
VPYHHVVFTLPAVIAKIAWHNKRQVYDLLFKASAETLLTIDRRSALWPAIELARTRLN